MRRLLPESALAYARSVQRRGMHAVTKGADWLMRSDIALPGCTRHRDCPASLVDHSHSFSCFGGGLAA